ncbi:hypothetical protein UG55_1007216 [Frankia sp. EI5c]|nr:hypothetical protein UG55_1007216 [Frankia sp. EI5c]
MTVLSDRRNGHRPAAPDRTRYNAVTRAFSGRTGTATALVHPRAAGPRVFADSG